MNQETPPTLTEHEKRILQLVCNGLTNKQIAQSLGIIPRTVEFHLSKIFKKLNVTCRAAASVAAEKMGMLK